ncbi:RND transporter [Trinickia dabaoshanensis]|uniref:RND transporter n=1 Tax=Trinickia dabaoshanensis TaxID=564714 RepID=A0A2N7VRJ4_9BURK|nr:efflux transporter outer membrane subunit [Trinickia dabaoshanensis]PMS19772.1 RND transporter [Trinickia dabaoshanensis]
MSIRRSPRLLAASCTALALCALSACTVGPDYRGAPPVAADAIKAGAFVRAPGAGVVGTAPALNAWWRQLGDPQLDALVEAALAHNPDVHVAQARLRAARAQLMRTRADELPKVSADAAAVRMRSPDLSALSSNGNGGNTGRGPLQLYTAGLDASWEIDLFGGTRRSIEAAADEAEALDADLADTQVSLAAEVAQAYIDLRDEQQRLVLAQRSAELQQQMLTLTQQRRAHGTAADVDVERLAGQVQTTRAALVPLDQQITESLDRLAVLTGQAPGALDTELAGARPLPTLPATVPVGDAAALLRQRPDIRAAERRLASSNAQIGEHVADYFPKISLLGDLGFTAADPGHLFRKTNFSWLGVPYLQWNVLDFGRVTADVRSAQASRDEAGARYEHTVLAALEDANSALSRYGHQREHVVRLEEVDASAQRASTLMRQRYGAGVATAIDLLDTERTQFSAEQDVIAGRAQLIEDFIQLQKSLGLGWQTQAS